MELSVTHQLVKRVSRSFGLSLRLLSGRLRTTISLAYLLARASDSIADVATVPEHIRIQLLIGLPSHWPPGALDALGEVAGADRELLGEMPSLLGMLRTSPDREEIERVWQTIRSGQIFDLERFSAGFQPEGGPMRRETAAASGLRTAPVSLAFAVSLTLEETCQYAGLVAGCVGEFWTDICFKHLPDYSRETPEAMRRLGFSFGCGLQWVNILRDRHADASLGRIYIAPENFSAGLTIARSHLADGALYASRVRPRRLRAACCLPLLLAFRTLELIEAAPESPRVKVSRWFVWRSFARAVLR